LAKNDYYHQQSDLTAEPEDQPRRCRYSANEASCPCPGREPAVKLNGFSSATFAEKSIKRNQIMQHLI